MENKIELGKIVNTHGIKGELKVAFSDESLFEKGLEIHIAVKGEYVLEIVKSFRIHKNHMLVVLKGYDNINDVLKYKGNTIFIEREEEENYTSDLLNYKVEENGILIGNVKEILANSMQQIIVLDNGIMIPYVDEFIKDFDDDRKVIVVELIEGMRNEI